MNPTHIRIYINKLLSKLDQSKQERCEYMEGYRDGLAFAITAIREKELQIASTKAEPKPAQSAGIANAYDNWRFVCMACGRPTNSTRCLGASCNARTEPNPAYKPDNGLGPIPNWLPTPEECDECEREPSAPGSREASDLGDGC